MDGDSVVTMPDTQNNNNHNNHAVNNKSDSDGRASGEFDGDREVMSVLKDVSEAEQTNDSANYSPPPPKKIAKRSRGSTRKSSASPRLKVPTPNSGTSIGSSSEREPNSSPASIENPATNGSTTNDVDGDGDKSDKTESGDSQSVSSSMVNLGCSNGPAANFSSSLTKRSVTLQMLLAAGVLKPGDGTMSLEYHGQKFLGDLLENGQIRSQETSQTFTSPSAWAIACKQIINPDKIQRKSGCGWASIKYRGLKLDYYKTVWFKRLREGSIDVRNLSNGAALTSDDEDDEDVPYHVLKFGEHLDTSPSLQTAQQLGAKVLISCTSFREIDRLQPFYVKMSAQALALADFHCNVTNTESLGYISGRWNNDLNCLDMEVTHPCRVLMPNSSSLDCDNERNRIALEIQRLGHDVVGWYHSHPKAPPEPSKDDITRQLDYQILMKGASESSYIPCIGVIISPVCHSNQEDLKSSPLKFFWVLPPPENRPMELGRPMHIDYETYISQEFDLKKMVLEMSTLVQFYRQKKDFVDILDVTGVKFDKVKASMSSWIPDLSKNDDFWLETLQLFTAPLPVPCSESTGSTDTSTSSISSAALNSACASASTPNSTVSNSTPPVVSTPTLVDESAPPPTSELEKPQPST